MERAFKLTKFRNFGLNKPERLVLNHSVEKGKMGELVILIGPNNAGKSNVLDALTEFSKNSLSDRDKTTLEYSPDYANPEVSFTVKNGEEEIYGKKVKINKSEFFMDIKNEETTFTEEDLEDAKTQIEEIAAKRFSLLLNNNCSKTHEELQSLRNSIITTKSINDLYKLAEQIYNTPLMQKFRESSNRLAMVMMDTARDITHIKLYLKYKSSVNRNAQDVFKAKYGINLIPNIIKYVPQEISENNLVCTPSNIKSNPFFSSLFNDKEIEKINNAYATLRTHNNLDILDELADAFDDKIETINKRFNKMYFAEKNKYKFSFKFLDNKIGFGIKRGTKSAILNYQSTGFKWFFNFYFNFLNNTKFEPGDIIIMDEPATNLHPQGQVELRRFIKELARRSDITFVIATHSPFLIDVDNYDELRVISIEDNISHIGNLFTAIDLDDPDTLLPIKESLTIQQHILYDYDTTVIFVEGITDYNYLTLFKKMLGFERLAFVPIKGLGKKGEGQERVIRKLAKIGRNPILLVDSDGAGKAVQKYVKDNEIDIEVRSLDETVSSCVEIEDLFSKQDQLKYKVKEKDAFYTSLIKNITGKDDFTKETVENFKAVLKNLEN